MSRSSGSAGQKTYSGLPAIRWPEEEVPASEIAASERGATIPAPPPSGAYAPAAERHDTVVTALLRPRDEDDEQDLERETWPTLSADEVASEPDRGDGPCESRDTDPAPPPEHDE